ncbi:hypothetical protein FACS1894199_15580 [Bacteroidia bacterium]|nr:hypothetical protein FACS1894199_15580 [Bacteroidia bacterium]
MKKQFILFTLLGTMLSTMLGLIAVGTILTSCEDEDWDPTWAMPLVKDQTYLISEFLPADMPTAESLNDSITYKWNQFKTANDPAVVDSTAYTFLTDTASGYVDLSGTTPKLNDETKGLISNPATVTQIDGFLKDYKDPTVPAGGGGGGSAVSSLLDELKDPSKVISNAGNLITAMGGDSGDTDEFKPADLDKQIDSLLAAAMLDTMDLDLKSLIKEGESPNLLEIGLGLKGDQLPFIVKVRINFVGDNGYSKPLFNFELKSAAQQETTPPFTKDEIAKIIKDTKGVEVKVECSRNPGDDAFEILKKLQTAGIIISLRVRVQAKMGSVM